MIWRASALVVTLVALVRVCTSAPPGEVILGAPTDASINTPEVREALKFAVDAFNMRINDPYMFKVGKVIKAQSQVVEGILYIFEVEMVGTGCKKGTEMKPCNKCYKAEPTSKPYTCSFEVWSRPWLGPPVIYKDVCQQQSS
ncbi:hypothetical protein ACEWY4_021066 [Coilia grayii]|uniref:Cystatin domain-containing protein n=1 Tax=Coilia grayii TaxID=363190 RepID=A0ABD1J7Y8_9TELE